MDIESIEGAILQVARALPSHIRWSWKREERSETALWQELVSCILGSCVRHEHAVAATDGLVSQGILVAGSPSRSLRRQLERALRRPASIQVDGLTAKFRYRFPLLRARQIWQTARAIYGAGSSLQQVLDEAHGARQARAHLVSLAYGVGPKQASLFLRNIGYGELAILDRHILRFMYLRHLLPKYPMQLGSIKRYEAVEELFKGEAVRTGLSLKELDIATWIVMRAADGSNWR